MSGRNTIRACLFFAFAVVAYPQSTDSMGKLQVTVKDEFGAVIPYVTLVMHCNVQPGELAKTMCPEENRVLNSTTGHFLVDVGHGYYDIAVFSNHFSPAATKLWIDADQLTHYTAKLQYDPQQKIIIDGLPGGPPLQTTPSSIPANSLPLNKK